VRAIKRPVSRALVRSARAREGLPAAGGAVALTFDDGPDPEFAPAFLDELRRLRIVATFFVVGHRARARPDLVRRALDEGHAVGSHSDTHPEPWTLPLGALTRDYRRGRQAAEAVVGRRVRLFRPPKGYLDGTGAVAMFGAGAIEGPLAPSALDRSATLAALPAVADLVRSRGLRFTTLA
jgi:peptidoglycan/xylan/chitin deacetylase (PgdA/CDA1 family)